jgi:hypothetical protein
MLQTVQRRFRLYTEEVEDIDYAEDEEVAEELNGLEGRSIISIDYVEDEEVAEGFNGLERWPEISYICQIRPVMMHRKTSHRPAMLLLVRRSAMMHPDLLVFCYQ